ncbi:glutathione S-transferase [Cylindrobasidium torrendii FP15055 ss-10]|uniref:glutathione transferase n=1 Tax=Cylindrobasidium torrendii FP15055 ss-10 TaxID=1314674 RepID=A0A0D7BCL6_9AGAR|nr:glutathione S-transferase [Cylindrobasidium torrendii FP15055 ss-10]
MSTCTKRVALVLHEKKVPFVFHPIDLSKGEHKAPEYVAKQPFGQVPYVEDEGMTIFESRAIGRYIAMQYAEQGTPLIPTNIRDMKKTVAFEIAMQMENQEFDPYVSKIGMEKIILPLKVPGFTPREEVVQEAIVALSAKLDVYEKILSKQKYLAGDEISLADLNHLQWGVLLKYAGIDIMESKPAVAKWWKELTERPSWQALVKGIESVEKYD